MIEVFCGPQSGNGKPHRDVVVRNIDGKEYRDKIDTDSGFQRQGLLERAAEQFGVEAEDLKPLDREIVRQAGIEDERAEAKLTRIPPPCSLKQLVSDHPTLRPAVIDGLLRQGETMNLVATPKAKKSWLVNNLGLAVMTGRDWLDKFPCTPGRVLILDAELHPEVIAHRWPAVAGALGIERGYDEFIDVVPLRGKGVDLFDMAPFVMSIEPGRYALVILDAWYRFLPPGISENDNAQVMALYNRIDAYTAHLGAAWVNVHHASKGDQSGKSATDVGSGAGSQSRAADTHLIIRPHQEENMAVVDAVVRSWPPVERFCIRWEYPAWQLDSEADPRKLWVAPSSRERAKETRDAHLEEDRQMIVNAMLRMAEPQTKTFIRDSSVGNPRFGIAWASLLSDKVVVSSGTIRKGNNRPYEGFILAQEKTE
jgi:RecA-family ATPase